MNNDDAFHINTGMLNRNKRQAGRVSVYIEATYVFNRWPSDCVILNLSVSGAAVKVPQFFSVEDVIELKFDLPLARDISAIGNVRYMRGTTIGVQFMDMLDATRDAIAAFIQDESRKMMNRFNQKIHP